VTPSRPGRVDLPTPAQRGDNIGNGIQDGIVKQRLGQYRHRTGRDRPPPEAGIKGAVDDDRREQCAERRQVLEKRQGVRPISLLLPDSWHFLR
jgi:hypothetical protein